jgi:hypothetical protein
MNHFKIMPVTRIWRLTNCLNLLTRQRLKVTCIVFIFAPYINSIKTLYIVPTDAHYYKIIEILKQFKIIILAPTCFSSRRNHNQGAVLCLDETTKWLSFFHTNLCTFTYNYVLVF